MSVSCGWSAGALAASHAAAVLDVAPALRPPLDPCQRTRILRLANAAITEPPPDTAEEASRECHGRLRGAWHRGVHARLVSQPPSTNSVWPLT
jgi:hypothetical protein